MVRRSPPVRPPRQPLTPACLHRVCTNDLESRSTRLTTGLIRTAEGRVSIASNWLKRLTRRERRVDAGEKRRGTSASRAMVPGRRDGAALCLRSSHRRDSRPRDGGERLTLVRSLTWERRHPTRSRDAHVPGRSSSSFPRSPRSPRSPPCWPRACRTRRRSGSAMPRAPRAIRTSRTSRRSTTTAT